jgi:hypothetical protein
MTPQEVFDKAYNGAYAAIWDDYFEGKVTLDQALERLLKAWRKAASQVRKRTGHDLWDPEEA